MNNQPPPIPNPPPAGEPSKGPPFNFACPHCRSVLSVEPSFAGSTASCPSCSGKFQIPLPTAAPFSSNPYGSNAGRVGSGFVNAGGAWQGSSPEVRNFANKKIAAGICGIMLGGLGVHKFILGFNGAGAMMLTVWLLGFITGACLIIPLFASVAMNIIGLVEGILYLTKSDEEFYQLYAVQRKDWF